MQAHSIVLRLLPLALFATSCVHATAAAPGEGTQDIVAEATSSVQVPPDQAVVRLGVEVRAALQIPASAIRTERVQLTPVYSQPTEPGSQPEAIGFQASTLMSVEVELDPEQLGARVGLVIDRAVAAGANQLEGVTFQLK